MLDIWSFMVITLNRLIGSIFILIGTEVGAGILALPILVAHYGFIVGCVLLFVTWLIMTYTTFVVCDINLSMPSGTNFAGMSQKIFGFWGLSVAWVCMLLILYPIMIAYISAAGSTFGKLLNIPTTFAIILFVFFLSVFVINGTSKVDFINKILLSLKLLLLIVSCMILSKYIHYNYLTIVYKVNLQNLLISVPVFITSFVGHIIIPTLRVYLHSDIRSIKRVLWGGCIVPLILYVLWIMVIIGNISPIGKDSVYYLNSLGNDASVGDVLEILKNNLKIDYFMAPVLLFTTISVSTSFLSVSTALKDFLIDGLKLNRIGYLYRQIYIVLLVFILPVVICLLFDKIFLKALNFVGIFCIIISIIMPMLMVIKYKFNNIFYLTNKVIINYLVLFIGVLLLVFQVFSLTNTLQH